MVHALVKVNKPPAHMFADKSLRRLTNFFLVKIILVEVSFSFPNVEKLGPCHFRT